jgi:hypothetical protein
MEALTCNEAKTIFEGRNKDDTASLRQVSLQCDDTADIIFVAPDNKREPFFALVDLKRRGKTEGVVFDHHRSGSKWDTSVWDPQGDENLSFERLASGRKAYAQFICSALRHPQAAERP